ncbi:MAG: Coenzyme F420 hydrogenase/dehydrogenase, beta subunit C-terminal domain [Coprobacter sp.]|nr:Coenzyme F420 hydrogenase/dehydrogenase, beta subunit C-terminal domain [Coprobacter sp.]
MSLDRSKGFYYPKLNKDVNDGIIKKICPGITIHGNGHHGIWGNVVEVVEGWSASPDIRYKAASGGVVTSLAIYLLETRKVDAVLQVGVRRDSYIYNELQVSKCKEDVLRNAQSRYAPALTLYNIKELLDNSDEKYAFIGKPCDIAGIKNLCKEYPQYNNRFELFISIFCAGMPSYEATAKTWRLSGRKDEPCQLKYRGDGWPGNFKATWADGETFELSYNDSWGKILGRNVCFRCKICPDGIGLLADIAVGDSWNTKDGYPDFTEEDGRCFVFIRSRKGSDLLSEARDKEYLKYHKLPIDKIQEMQPYQYERRKFVWWRLLPIYLISPRLLQYGGLGLFRQAVNGNIVVGIKNFKGASKRYLKMRWEAVKK